MPFTLSRIIVESGKLMADKRGFIILFLIGILLIPVSGQSASTGQKYGGTLVWGVFNKPTIINPLLTTQSVSASLQDLIFNSLVRWNSKGGIEPDLAEKWEVSPNGLVYTFYLKKNIRFHDGVELTAEDAKFTFDKISDPQAGSPFRSFFKVVKEFKVIDKYAFQVILSKPAASFIYKLIRPIVPRHLLENGDLKNSPFNFQPIGSGPFKFKEWGKDNQITLEYNPDYYAGRPYLDKIIVKSYADSREAWVALMRQEVDLVLFLEKDDYEVVKKDPAFKAYTFALDRYYGIVYNLEDPVLSDKRIRETIAYGVDRKKLIERAAFGYGQESCGPFYPGSAGFNPEVEAFGFNPEKAAILLAEAGWQDNNLDGLLEKDGQVLEIRMLVDSRNDAYRRVAMFLRQQLQEIGIRLVVQLYDDDSKLTAEFLAEHKPQAQLKLLLAGIDPDQVAEEWSSKKPEGVFGLWKYINPEIERFFALGRTTQDQKKKEWVYEEAHKFIYQDQPVCFLYFPLCFHAISARFENTDGFFTLSMPLYLMRQWAIAKKNDIKTKGGE